MKLLILLIAITVFTFSEYSLAQDCQGPRNFIFLIHGIGGNAATFGSMADVLMKKNPCYQASNFVYETGSELGVHEFSSELDAFIESTLKNFDATEADKISFIMHSQGGIVGSLWLEKAMVSNLPLFKRMDAFITLSTPFWGSSMAKWGRRFFFTLPEKMDNPISPFGKNELLDMSYGSSTISELNDNYQQIFEAGPHIRGLSIGGIKPGYSAHYGEDDTTVSIYSSRPDHYLMSSTLHGDGTMEVESSKKTKFHPYVIVHATHAATPGSEGVADIPEKCLTECDHPSLPLIFSHLEKTAVAPTAPEEFKLRKFRLHIYVQDLEKYGLKGEDLRFSYQLRKKWFHRVGKRKRRSENGFSFAQFTKGEGAEELLLLVRIKGVERGRMMVPVEGGYSTFINLKLDGL